MADLILNIYMIDSYEVQCGKITASTKWIFKDFFLIYFDEYASSTKQSPENMQMLKSLVD